jgi:hypothetical protein
MTATVDLSTAAERRLGRAVTVGSLIGFVAISLVVAVAGIAWGMETGSAIGLGVFVGMWSGAGFGFMMGATFTLARDA